MSAARRINTERTGLFLCGIVDEPPPLPSASSPISGRLPVATSAAMCPHASQQLTNASPMRVIADRVVCQGGAGASRRAPASASLNAMAPSTEPVNSVAAASVPTAPPTCTGSEGSSPVSGSAASSMPVSQRAILAPRVLGSAAWVRVRASAGVLRCLSASSDSPRTWRANSSPMRMRTSRAQMHQRCVDDVLTG